METAWDTAGLLWFAVFASGLYHGVNPGMGWPLAVSAALFEQRRQALWPALGALGTGHFLAMLAILMPFSMLTLLVQYERELRLGAALLVTGMGLYLLATRRHPRFLSRIPPARQALWSFLVALAHGAALMLVPVYLGLCAADELEGGHAAASFLMTNTVLAAAVAVLHTAAMVLSGGAMAFAVHRWLGLRFLNRGWFDLELLWAGSLLAAGLLTFWAALGPAG
ncbi:hypothetical protein [Cribrihabitans neustonicus]|uniref:hypothetical protein n=1 Tax=Cribrihabitans neustonicus TaxID=1429085 RepID=UPI003B59E946